MTIADFRELKRLERIAKIAKLYEYPIVEKPKPTKKHSKLINI